MSLSQAEVEGWVVLLVLLWVEEIKVVVQLNFKIFNNETEYKALLVGLQATKIMGTTSDTSLRLSTDCKVDRLLVRRKKWSPLVNWKSKINQTNNMKLYRAYLSSLVALHDPTHLTIEVAIVGVTNWLVLKIRWLVTDVRVDQSTSVESSQLVI